MRMMYEAFTSSGINPSVFCDIWGCIILPWSTYLLTSFSRKRKHPNMPNVMFSASENISFYDTLSAPVKLMTLWSNAANISLHQQPLIKHILYMSDTLDHTPSKWGLMGVVTRPNGDVEDRAINITSLYCNPTGQISASLLLIIQLFVFWGHLCICAFIPLAPERDGWLGTDH